MQIPANIPLVSGKSIFQFLEYSRFTYHSLISLSRFFKYPHKAFFGIIFVRFCPNIFRWFVIALVLFSTLDFLDSLAGLAHSESFKNFLSWLPFFEAASSAWARNNSFFFNFCGRLPRLHACLNRVSPLAHSIP